MTQSDPFVEAIDAAKAVFKRHGMQRPQVVINVVWRGEHGGVFAAGTRVPSRPHSLLVESLEASAEEARQ